MSGYWGGTTVGDALVSAPYTDDFFSDVWSLLFTYDRTLQGVILTANTTYNGMLAVTNPAGSTIRVAKGAALVDGKIYQNTANVDNAVATPGAGTNYYRVVLQKSFAAQTVRVALLGPSVVATPALTQTDGTTWEISLATVTVSDAGVITITNTRSYVGDGSENNSVYLRAYRSTASTVVGVLTAPLTAQIDGNARGAGAVDLQTKRSVATYIAGASQSFLAGGYDNRVDSQGSDAAIVGGYGNYLDSLQAGIFVGGLNTIEEDSDHSVILGGVNNTIDGEECAILSGNSNEVGPMAGGNSSAIVGGSSNTLTGGYGFMGGGSMNVVSEIYSAMIGGFLNEISSQYSAIIGGSGNSVSGNYSVALGGELNDASGARSLVAGRRAHDGGFDGVFVWSDSEDLDFVADRDNQFKIRASGGVIIRQNDPASSANVLWLTQQDVDTSFLGFEGDTDAGDVTRNLVVDGDATPTSEGYFKVYIKDDGDRIADGYYYVQLFSLAVPV